MVWSFEAKLIEWRGPAPFHFLAVPETLAGGVKEAAALHSYGWGVVPVHAVLGATEFTTSLIPRKGVYLLPIKDAVRHAEGLVIGDTVSVRIGILGGRRDR